MYVVDSFNTLNMTMLLMYQRIKLLLLERVWIGRRSTGI